MRIRNLVWVIVSATICAHVGACLADTAAPLPAPLVALENGSAMDNDAPPAQQTTVQSDLSAKLHGGLRLESIQTEGLRDGTQAGLAWRYGQIEALLNAQSLQLDQVYDFSKVMINSYVLPPVISVVHNVLRQDDDNTARVTRVGYRIEYPARIVTVPPQWRSFLIKSFQPPQPPSQVILPHNATEQKIWKAAVAKGWARGVMQADAVFSGSLSLLTSTYTGMLKYKELLREGIVTEPVTARTDLGVMIDGHELNVGDTLFRLTKNSRFQPVNRWQPKLQKD
ncbi:MAG: hypothetical protein EPN72_10320 [Nevskiaceae bacterium]|nr:MAG: hypothetical protein EPN61_01920 [Burkholderiaceae bacterium]TBR72349.1 MAG: hypothetical protein EPN72_10320 [Nevskiaceae bacterium]